MLLSFQLTPSRRATLARLQLAMRIGISTHALTEGDSSSWELIPKLFISTHALTEGDRHECTKRIFFVISTHALTEGDVISPRNTAIGMLFQLTPSRRATGAQILLAHRLLFQLTPSRRATRRSNSSCSSFVISTHALTEGDMQPIPACGS